MTLRFLLWSAERTERRSLASVWTIQPRGRNRQVSPFGWMLVIANLVFISDVPSFTHDLLGDDNEQENKPQKKVSVDEEREARLKRLTESFDRQFLANYGLKDQAEVRARLDAHLAKKLDELHLLCTLTSEQRPKFELAGRVDIKQLINKLEETRREYQSISLDKGEEQAAKDVRPAMFGVQRAMQKGIFDDESKFAKIRRGVLTTEQLEKYDQHHRKIRAKEFYEYFYPNSNVDDPLPAAKQAMIAMAQRKLATVDRLCQLSGEQCHLLETALNEDIARIVKRYDDMLEAFLIARDQGDKYQSLNAVGQMEIQKLRSLFKAGPFDFDSEFLSAQASVLTPEQRETIEQRQQEAANSQKKISVENARQLTFANRISNKAFRMQFSRDGSQMFLLELRKPFEIRSARDGTLLRTIGDGQNFSDFAVSPDERLVAVTDIKNRVQLMSTVGGEERHTDSKIAGGSGSAFSPDGKLLATGSSSSMQTWSVEAGESVREFQCGQPQGYLSPVFSPDGTKLAVGNRNGSTRLFDVATGEMLFEFPHGSSHELKFDPTGKRLAVAYVDGDVIIWDVETGKKRVEAKSKGVELYALDWSPDGSLLATCGHGTPITIWETSNMKVLLELDCPMWVMFVRFSPDGTRLLFPNGLIAPSDHQYLETWSIP